jgi:hypothetical protein
MALKPIKFYKSSVAPSAAAIGSVWFDTTNRLINVRIAESGDNQWQSYSGLQNARWDEAAKSLILTKADGSALTVNLSDVASASALSALTTRVSTAEQAIVDNKAAADQGIKEAKDAAGAVSTALGEYKTANDARVKSAEDAHSGYVTSNDARVLAVEGRASALETTTAEHAEAIEALQGAVGEGGSVGVQIDNKIAALDATVGSQVIAEGKHVAVEVVEVDGKLTAATVVEDFSDITKSISDEETRALAAEAAINEKIGGSYSKDATVAADIQAAKDAAAAAQSDIDAFMKGEAIEGSTLDTLKEIQSWIAADETGTQALIGRVSANETNISNLQEQVGEGKVADRLAATQSAAEATAKAYTDATAGVYAAEGVEASGLRKEIAERDAATLVSAKAYTDELANGAVAANTAALALVDGKISTAKGEAIAAVKGDAVDYDTLGKVEAKLDAIDEAIAGVNGAAVKSVSGSTYVEVTEGQNPVVSVKTGAVADGGDVLATSASVKSYVDDQIVNS